MLLFLLLVVGLGAGVYLFVLTKEKKKKNNNNNNEKQEQEYEKPIGVTKLEENQTIERALEKSLPNDLFAGDQAGSSESCLLGTSTSTKPDNAESVIQTNGKGKEKGKAGWCYIGEDRGFQSCAFTDGSKPKCMSEQIFPSLEACHQYKF